MSGVSGGGFGDGRNPFVNPAGKRTGALNASFSAYDYRPGAAGGGYLQPQVASVRGAAGVDHGRGDSAPAAAQPTGSAS